MVYARHRRHSDKTIRHSNKLKAFISTQNTRLSEGAVKATNTLSMPTNPTNGQTVTIDGKVYTFQTTLTGVDGNVHIGATAADSVINLFYSINSPENGGAPGSDYALQMTDHPTVETLGTIATAPPVGTDMIVRAKTAGVGGNSLAASTNVTGASWAGANFAGGAAASAFDAKRSLKRNTADEIERATDKDNLA